MSTGFDLTKSMYLDGAFIAGAGTAGSGGVLHGIAPNPAPPPAGVLSIDGTAFAKFFNSATGTAAVLTTTQTNAVIIVVIANGTLDAHGGDPVVSSITSTSGLTFARLGGAHFDNTDSSAHQNLEVWWAKATAVLTSETITAHLSVGADNVVGVAFGIHGANTTAPADVNANAIVFNTTTSGAGPSVSLSTTNANDLLLFVSCSSSTASPNSGAPSEFTNMYISIAETLGSSWIVLNVSTDIVSATQTSLALAPSLPLFRHSGICGAVAIRNA